MERWLGIKPTLFARWDGMNPGPVFTAVFAAVLTAMLVPVWFTDWPPLQDVGGHIELMDVMHRYTDPSTAYFQTYNLPDWFSPNSLSLAAAWLLGPFIGTLSTTKVLLSFYIVGMPLSLVAVARSFGRSPWLVLIGTPFVFNALLNVGFINYLIALPLMFWMVPLAKRYAEGERIRECVGLGICSLLLFYAHVIAFLIGWSMAAFVLLLHGRPRSWVGGLCATIPSLVLLGVWIDRMFLDPIATELGRTFGTQEQGLATTFKPLIQKVTSFHAWGTNFFRSLMDEVVLGSIALFWLMAFGQSVRSQNSSRRSALDMVRHYSLEVMTVVCALAYVSLPSGANEIAILTERVPIMIMVFLLLWPRGEFKTRFARWMLVPASLIALSYPAAVQTQFARFESEEVGDLEDVIAQMDEGSKLAYVLERPASTITYMKPLWHIPKAMHAVKNGGTTHDSFAIRPYTPIQYKDGQSPTRVRTRFDRTASVYEYDYVLMQTRRTPDHLLRRKGVSLVVNKDSWWLFSVEDPDDGAIVLRSPGRGGFQDAFDCPPGTALTGLSGENLAVVGSLTPTCSGIRRSLSRTTEISISRGPLKQKLDGPSFGRPMRQGRDWDASCPRGQAIVGLRGLHDGFVQGLDVVCQSSTSTPPDERVVGVGAPYEGVANFELMCPPGTVASGYRGRSGLFIDQVGLRCDAIPMNGMPPNDSRGRL